MSVAPLRILSITGWCRNGSTIIGNVLNEIPGFFHVGEIHFLWKNAAARGANNLCGCGKPLTGCEIWAPILRRSLPAGVTADEFAETVIARQRSWVRTRHTWRVLKHGPRTEGLREHAALMAWTYHAIADRMGANVIVETTKIPGESALLPFLDGVEPFFVHLVRDPRAVAESWREPKQYVYAMPAWKSTAYWVGFNVAAHAITRRHPQRSMFLRYEDFIAEPAATIDALIHLMGADASANPLRDRTIELHTNHTVTGNPDRFRTGVVSIRDSDDAWRTGLSAPASAAATTLSWPLSRRYGYTRANVRGRGLGPRSGKQGGFDRGRFERHRAGDGDRVGP